MTFDVGYAIQILPVLLQGAVITVVAALLSFVVAAVLGLLLAVARFSGSRSVQSITTVGVDLIRGTPLLIQLFVAFYLFPFYGLTLEPLVAGVAVLGIHYSCYTSEVYRAGITGVPRGQWEAAKALNMPGRQVWRRIILPQAVPRVIPPLGNYLVAIFKETPILATITVGELLRAAMTEAGLTFRFLEPFVLVGAFFLLMSYPSTVFIHWLERRYVVA